MFDHITTGDRVESLTNSLTLAARRLNSAFHPRNDGIIGWYENDDQSERLPVPESSKYTGAAKLNTDGPTTIVLVADAGEFGETATFVHPHDGEKCTDCTDNEAYTPSRGTPGQQACTNRQKANCAHANAAQDIFALNSSGYCEECGSWEVRVEELHPHPVIDNAVAGVVEYCADCDTLRH